MCCNDNGQLGYAPSGLFNLYVLFSQGVALGFDVAPFQGVNSTWKMYKLQEQAGQAVQPVHPQARFGFGKGRRDSLSCVARPKNFPFAFRTGVYMQALGALKSVQFRIELTRDGMFIHAGVQRPRRLAVSGHSVLIPSVAPEVATATMSAAGTALTAGLAVYALAHGVKKLVESQVDGARSRMAAEKQRLAEWMQFQAAQLRSMELFRQTEAALHAAEERLASLGLADVARRAAQAAGEPSAPSAEAYLSLGASRMTPEQVQSMFHDMTAIFEALPETFRAAEDSPFPKLAKQRKRLEAQFAGGGRASWREVASFKETLSRTVADYAARTAARREHDEAALARLEILLDDLLFHRELARGNEERSALEALLSQAVTLFERRTVKTGQLELMEKRLEAIKKGIAQRVVRTAHRTGLCESITRHLGTMGYGMVSAFPSDPETPNLEASFKIPGGDRICIAITENEQIHFELQHERLDKAGILTPSDWMEIRRQERRWCQDFKELVRRLVAEGFSYEVASERLVPEQAIKVVVVDTPEDILAMSCEETPERIEEKKRYLS